MSNPRIEIDCGSLSLMGTTFLIFAALRVTGWVEWPWWLITATLWGPLVLIFGTLVVAVSLCTLWRCGVAVVEYCREILRAP